MSSSPAAFSVRVLWHAPAASPHWELVTEHLGFSNPLAAALFAEGLSQPALGMLLTSAGRCELTLSDRTTIDLLGQDRAPSTTTVHFRNVGFVVRKLAEPGDTDDQVVRLVGCEDYDECAIDALLHAWPGVLQWAPIGFAVEGPEGPMDVSLSFDESGEILRATVEPEQVTDQSESAVIALIPRA
jgi:hypothetical protein